MNHSFKPYNTPLHCKLNGKCGIWDVGARVAVMDGSLDGSLPLSMVDDGFAHLKLRFKSNFKI
jgi:hypothetical protein